MEKSREMGCHPGGNPGANLKLISHRCYLFAVAFVWELNEETIVLPLGCLQGGEESKREKSGLRDPGIHLWGARLPSRWTAHGYAEPGKVMRSCMGCSVKKAWPSNLKDP